MEQGTRREAALFGHCGLYCGACDVYRLYQNGLQEQRTPAWTELPEQLRQNIPFKSSPIRCQGCRSDTVFAGCSHCPLRACAQKRGNVVLCADCSEYPCFRTRLFGVVAWLFSLEKRLPHLKTKAVNVARIHDIGVERWLVEQEQQWRCPQCQTPFSWYQPNCRGCGRELDSLKGFMTPTSPAATE